jgi:hypothetical protein
MVSAAGALIMPDTDPPEKCSKEREGEPGR